MLVAPSTGSRGRHRWVGGQRSMDRGIRNPEEGSEEPSLAWTRCPHALPALPAPILLQRPGFRLVSLTHLMTLTRSWKALSTLRGGSLALVSMYGIWKAKRSH